MSKYVVPTGEWKCSANERKAINNVLTSGRISEGPKTKEFEKRFAEFIGTKYCISTNSGTSALIVGLRAMKEIGLLKDKQSVVVPAFTYIATVNSVIMAGFNPVFCDIHRQTFGLDPKKLNNFLSSRSDVGAVIVVHIMGIPAQIDKIKKVCKKHNVKLIEDTCQAYGTKYRNKMLGSWGLWSAHSFFVAHTLQCSELGAINTNDKTIARFCDKIKSNGRTASFDKHLEKYYSIPKWDKRFYDLHERYYHDVVGGNFRTQEFSTALACEQLKNVKNIIRKRNENVRVLNEALENYQDVIQLPKWNKNIAYLGYPLLINKPEKISRYDFRQKLEKVGIETRPLYGNLVKIMPSLEQHNFYRFRTDNALSVTDDVGNNAFYVGCHQHISNKKLDYMIKAFKKILEEV